MTDCEVAIAVAEAGAGIVRGRFGTALRRLDKGAGDFATNADVEAEKAMIAILRRERPHDGIVGEETGCGGAMESARRWLLDPLCGTLNYAARTRVAGVNAALREGGRSVAAAVADPFGHEVYWADASSAYVRSERHDLPLVPDAGSRLVDLNLDPPFPSAPAFQTAMLAGDPVFTAAFRPRVVSTSIALVWVATGQRAAYVTDGDLRDSVHFTAGVAICEAAGCVVTDLLGHPWGHSPTGLLAAADSATHAALLAIVRNVWRQDRGQRERDSGRVDP